MHIFLIWTEVPFIQDVSGVYTSASLTFEKRAPGTKFWTLKAHNQRFPTSGKYLVMVCVRISNTVNSLIASVQTLICTLHNYITIYKLLYIIFNNYDSILEEIHNLTFFENSLRGFHLCCCRGKIFFGEGAVQINSQTSDHRKSKPWPYLNDMTSKNSSVVVKWSQSWTFLLQIQLGFIMGSVSKWNPK